MRFYRHYSALILALLPLPIVAQEAARALPSDKYEQPQYKVVERVGNVEVREYAPMLLAEVDIDGDRNEAVQRGFRVLAGYIFGGNTRKEGIAMTSPVTQLPTTQLPTAQSPTANTSEKIAMTSPVTQSLATTERGESRWTIGFMMPSKYTLESLPKPNDGQIRFRMSVPETRVAVRFSGISSRANLAKHRAELYAFVQERKLDVVGQPIIAYYDDPFTLPWNRRNEWWVAVKNAPTTPVVK